MVVVAYFFYPLTTMCLPFTLPQTNAPLDKSRHLVPSFVSIVLLVVITPQTRIKHATSALPVGGLLEVLRAKPVWPANIRKKQANHFVFLVSQEPMKMKLVPYYARAVCRANIKTPLAMHPVWIVKLVNT